MKPTPEDLIEAAFALKEGQLVAFPTETVYGLGVDACNQKSVARLYKVKGRPSKHPIIVHISSINRLELWASKIPNYALQLALEFWPGPLTLILPKTSLAENYITGGQDNVGIRVPSENTALTLLGEFEKIGGLGVAAPSANRFGAVSPTSAEAVFDELSDFLDPNDLILKGDSCRIGIESTIIDCTRDLPLILRPGAITKTMIENSVKKKIDPNEARGHVKSPGLLKSHYSPAAVVSICGLARKGDGFIALSHNPTPPGAVRLAAPNDVQEYARDLYNSLRSADEVGIARVVVIPPKGDGLALAIRDRLERAAGLKTR